MTWKQVVEAYLKTLFQAFAWSDWGKPRKTFISIFGLWVEFQQVTHLLSFKQEKARQVKRCRLSVLCKLKTSARFLDDY